ncbi:MAG TPA: hypothetical protein PKE47_03850, partial [Verrucomicrobiota bacterium]|nr:hypothetical protein [Verrucomicrobiota bacterium]
VIGGADPPGQARDLAIEGDLAVVLDGGAGLALFELADTRSPVRVAQFPLAGPVSIALSGGLALGGQNTGATLLDVRSPASPLVLTNFPGGAAHAVALASPYGYVSRGTEVLTMDLATGALLPPLGLPAAVDEFAVDGDLLYVLTREALHIFRRAGGALAELSRTAVAGSPAPLEAGRKLFAGGGRAYVGYFTGFTILDVANPAAPVVLATQPATQAAIHDLADNGSGRLAAITSFGGTGSLAFSLYDVAAGTTTTNFLTSLATPGDPFAVVLHRGLAYVADDDAGLQVINYLPRDTAGVRPDIAFGPPLSVAPVLEAGSSPPATTWRCARWSCLRTAGGPRRPARFRSRFPWPSRRRPPDKPRWCCARGPWTPRATNAGRTNSPSRSRRTGRRRSCGCSARRPAPICRGSPKSWSASASRWMRPPCPAGCC